MIISLLYGPGRSVKICCKQFITEDVNLEFNENHGSPTVFKSYIILLGILKSSKIKEISL